MNIKGKIMDIDCFEGHWGGNPDFADYKPSRVPDVFQPVVGSFFIRRVSEAGEDESTYLREVAADFGESQEEEQRYGTPGVETPEIN